MSRFNGKPQTIPEAVKVNLEDQKIVVEGPKGKLETSIPNDVKIVKSDSDIKFELKKDGRASMIGLAYHLTKNMMTGVVEGFQKKLEINGVGYRWNVQGNVLNLQVGFSYDVTYLIPEGITLTAKDNILTVEGIDKQRVGEVADDIKRYRPVEPYKGKGIRYVGEYVVRKVGKSGK